MASLAEVVGVFENCITDSVQDSIHEIERQFALVQTRHGYNVAIQALGMAFAISEQRRKHLASNSPIT